MTIVAKKTNPAEVDTPLTNKVALYVDCCDGKTKIMDDAGCICSFATNPDIELLETCICCLTSCINNIGSYLGCTTTSGVDVPEGTKTIKIYGNIGVSDYNGPQYLELTNEHRSASATYTAASRTQWSGGGNRCCEDNKFYFTGNIVSPVALFYS